MLAGILIAGQKTKRNVANKGITMDPVRQSFDAETRSGKGGTAQPLRTRDGRYLVVRGRLWRSSNPALADDARQHLVDQLMDARRAIAQARRAEDRDTEQRARAQVNETKIALGERGPVWWSDGEPDFNRYKIDNTPYANWYAQQVD